MLESNTDSVDLEAILMLFVLERVTVKQEVARNIIAHSTSKIKAEAGAAEDQHAETLTPKLA